MEVIGDVEVNGISKGRKKEEEVEIKYVKNLVVGKS